MTKCVKCGQNIPENVDICPNCGAAKVVEKTLWLYGLISAILFPVGIVLYYIWKEKLPRTINAIKQGLTASLVIYIVLIGLLITSAFSAEMKNIFTILVVLVLVFTQHSLTISVANKKGHNTTKAGFIGLIPVFGLWYYLTQVKAKKLLSPTTIPNIFDVKNIAGTMLLYAELTALVAVVLVPIIYVIGTSLSPNTSILNTLWPTEPDWINYKFLFSGERELGGEIIETSFTKWYWNTLQVAFLTMIGAVLFITGTAYIFARYRFKGKKAGLLTILVLQMFPSFLSLIALFTLFQTFGLTNEPKWLVIIYVSGAIPFNIWLIKGYLANIPKELDESAKIDGANKLQIFFRIILPLSVPIISFVAVTQFMAPWMDYILPSFLIFEEDKWTLAVGIFDFINDAYNINYPAFAAAAIIVALPITTLYVVFQRFLIEGITAGANKG